jgi:hypothetical protein
MLARRLITLSSRKQQQYFNLEDEETEHKDTLKKKICAYRSP